MYSIGYENIIVLIDREQLIAWILTKFFWITNNINF